MRMKLRTALIPAVMICFLLAGCSRGLYGREASDEIERRLQQKYDIEMSVLDAVAKIRNEDGMRYSIASFKDPDGGKYTAEVDGIVRRGGSTVRDNYAEK